MKILLVGAAGTLGQAIGRELGSRHDIISAGRNSGDVRVDMADAASVQAMFDKLGTIDAVVSAAGNLSFAALPEFTPELHAVGLRDKLMGQVHLVQFGLHKVADGGSFTLVSGIVGTETIRYGASAAMVNSAIDGYVRAAAIELPRGLRINSVSPTVVVESLPTFGPYFRGFKPVPVSDAALAFSKSVEGAETGKTYRVH